MLSLLKKRSMRLRSRSAFSDESRSCVSDADTIFQEPGFRWTDIFGEAV